MLLWRLAARQASDTYHNSEIRLFFLVMGGIFVLAGLSLWQGYATLKGPLQQEQRVLIPHGASTRDIAEILVADEIVRFSYLFPAIAWLMEPTATFKAGEYIFPEQVTPAEVVRILVSGKPHYRKVTITEGTTSFAAFSIIRNTDGLVGEMPQLVSEGALFPDTYLFLYGDTRTALVKRMHKKMQQELDSLWKKRDNDLGYVYSKEIALTLASIVEKEAARDDERGRIAAVLINRLRKGMRLQSDPTVIYGITQGKYELGRKLTRKDLKKETPWNTYTSKNLPTSPISLPGRASLQAVLNPPKTDELFFVADGEGGHFFSKSYDEHLRNVKKYRAITAAKKHINKLD